MHEDKVWKRRLKSALLSFKATTHSLLFLVTNVRSAYHPAGSQAGECCLCSVTEADLGPLSVFGALLSSGRAIQKPWAQLPPPAPGERVMGAPLCRGAVFVPSREEVYWSCAKHLVSDSGRNLSGVTSNVICLPSFYAESSCFLRYSS